MNEKEPVASADDTDQDSPPWPGDLGGVGDDEGDDGWVLPPEFDAVVAELSAAADAELAQDQPWQQLPPGAALGGTLAVLDLAGLSDYDLVECVEGWERQRRHAGGMLATVLAALAR